MLADKIRATLQQLNLQCDYWSVALQRRKDELLLIRHGNFEAPRFVKDQGLLFTVIHQGGLGYCSTQDLSSAGLLSAYAKAKNWAEITAEQCVHDYRLDRFTSVKGQYETTPKVDWFQVPVSTKFEILSEADRKLRDSKNIVDSVADFWAIENEIYFLNSLGAETFQKIQTVNPYLSATAVQGEVAESRSFHAHLAGRQGGFEVLGELEFTSSAERIREEALELASAPVCESDTMSLLLAPDQMTLQIHESIGHPLELDRILGDERNYAGTSFVTKDMFGSYQFGSKLLNVTVDPSVENQVCSWRFDEEGMPCEKEYVIRDGILERGLGGSLSQERLGVAGVANSRSTSWNRPPIDRMTNLNIESGTSSFDDMVRAVELGIYMQTNSSWSIDDSRNKFQFGCERARMIRNGKLAEVVRKPNYRGVSTSFWRSLKLVGDPSTRQVLGTPYCGKGEPNQSVPVGHASPACLFEAVSVFGGEA